MERQVLDSVLTPTPIREAYAANLAGLDVCTPAVPVVVDFCEQAHDMTASIKSKQSLCFMTARFPQNLPFSFLCSRPECRVCYHRYGAVELTLDSFLVVRKGCFAAGSLPIGIFGFNCYFLGFCSDQVRASVLAIASRHGANTLRVWAFLDVESPAPEATFFQSHENGAAVFNDGPSGLERFDALIHAAEEANIRLILPLVNFWPDFGGVPMYCKWHNIADGPTGFYRSPCRAGCLPELGGTSAVPP